MMCEYLGSDSQNVRIKNHKPNTSMTIHEIAAANNASIITDKDGDIAILRRHFDDEGVQQVRYSPDPCDHLPESEWEAMTQDQASARVC